ncbi:MAG: hypothetical protein ACOH2J_12105 [Allorhizobium sp.]
MRRHLAAAAVAMIIAAAFFAGSAGAASTPPVVSGEAYRDLPGVKPPGYAADEQAYDCSTVIRETRGHRRWRDDLFLEDGLPVMVYRCTRGNAVFESTRQPLSKGWFPGINPQFLPE